MPKVDVLRAQPVTPPIEAVTITLDQYEVQELAGILGQGSGLVGGLYWELSNAGCTERTAAYCRGENWVERQRRGASC